MYILFIILSTLFYLHLITFKKIITFKKKNKKNCDKISSY